MRRYLQRIVPSLLMRRWLLLVGATLAFPPGAAQDPGAQEDLAAAAQQARAEFALLSESRSLLWDWMAIEEFATLPGVEVIPTILDAAEKPVPRGLENRRCLLASYIGRRAGRLTEGPGILDSEAVVLLEFLSRKPREPAPVWAAYNAAFALAHRKAETSEVVKLVLEKSRPASLRAAMLLGLGDAGDVSVLQHVDPLLAAAARESRRAGRARLRQAIVWATAGVSRPLVRRTKRGFGKAAAVRLPGAGRTAAEISARRKEAVAALASVASLLDEKSLDPATRRHVMRALQVAWDTKVAYESAESWKQLGRHEQRRASGESSRTAVRFFGIPTSGSQRVLFLLDASDSMLTPLTPGEKEALRTLLQRDEQPDAGTARPRRDARAGQRGRTGVGSRAKRLLRVDDEAWKAVKTRFDAARAHLKHSLGSMSPGVEFAVVLFGNKAETLASTPSFLKATDRNRVRVVMELDSIAPGPRDAAHPYGRLRGETNLYAAFAVAFSLRAGRRASSRARTAVMDPRDVQEHADTMYLLSDGIPTRDGFSGRTPRQERGGYWLPATPEMKGQGEDVINPETGAKRKITYHIPARPRRYVPASKVSGVDATGPYVYPDALVDDICRRNLFLRATIHVVSIGEAGNFIGPLLTKAAGGRFVLVSKGRQHPR